MDRPEDRQTAEPTLHARPSDRDKACGHNHRAGRGSCSGLPSLCHLYWKYKGEGNANVVVSYVGPDQKKPGSGVVMRLRKSTVANPERPPAENGKDQYVEELPEFTEYGKEVIGELLGVSRIGNCKTIPVTFAFLEKLADHIRLARPPKRLHRDVDRRATWATLCSDHTVFSRHAGEPILSVEIKPKWGFLPSSPHIDPKYAPSKFATCRYCMHQAFKYPDDASGRSSYCPIDLFSGDELRMRKAIDSLQENPQNNFRLYINGENVPLDAAAFDMIGQFLSTDNGSGEVSGRVQLCSLLVSILRQERALEHLGNLQRSLDALDIEGIVKICEMWDGDPRFSKFLSREPRHEEWVQASRRFIQKANNPSSRRRDLAAMTFEESIQCVYEYLIAATLKDCSVFISIQSAESTVTAQPDSKQAATLAQELEGPISEVHHSLSGAERTVKFRYKLRFVDVDPKSIRKIPIYAELDRRIVENWIRVDGRKVCRVL